LPALSDELKTLLEERKQNWSYNAVTMTQSWLERGLKRRCISRDLKWGIPIPKKGFENKVFYSWFDAPIGYIGITAENRGDWKEWWMDKSTRLVQFMGKDNIPFHTIIFPGILIGSKEGYTLLDTISVNEYLNYEGGKFSKSQHKGIFGDDVVKLGIRSDVWRYYIIINRPEKADTDFTWEDFREKLNNELVANFGNLIQRIMVFLKNKYDSEVPGSVLEEEDKRFVSKVKEHAEKVEELFDRIQLKASLKEIMKIARLGNQYMQENKPWSDDVPQRRKDAAMNVLANLAKDLAILVNPIMPGASKDIFKQLNVPEQDWDALFDMSIKKGHKVGEATPLFSKMSDEQMKEFKARFSQSSKDRKEVKEQEKKGLDFSDLDLRVGHIKDVEEHPNADKLWVLKVDLGREERQLVAGLRKEYTSDELKGKNIVVVRNLKPAKLRGIKSQGMLLAGEGKPLDDGKEQVGLILANAESGSPVYQEGKEESAKAAKKKTVTIDELFDNFKMEVKQGMAYINGKKLFADGKPLKCERVVEGKIR
jgi:methionyl-tRNA synthetase